MNNKIKIRVTKKDIEKSRSIPERERTMLNCPIALAIKNKLKKEIYVSNNYAFTENNFFSDKHSKLDIRAQKFIKKFDKGERVSPITITVDASQLK